MKKPIETQRTNATSSDQRLVHIWGKLMRASSDDKNAGHIDITDHISVLTLMESEFSSFAKLNAYGGNCELVPHDECEILLIFQFISPCEGHHFEFDRIFAFPNTNPTLIVPR